MRFIIAFLVALMLSACATSPAPRQHTPLAVTHLEVHADTAFGGIERTGIQIAADAWRTQTAGLVDIEVTFDGKLDGIPLLRADTNSPLILEWDAQTGCLAGAGPCIMGQINTLGGIHNPHPDGGRVFLVLVDRASSYGLNAFARIVMHEFGHLLGLTHVPDPYAVMSAASDARFEGVELTTPDFSEFCRVNDCGGFR